MGYRSFKFFPAEVAGGVNALKAFSGPFPDVVFCPTGGIRQHTAKEYLALASVPAVGGTWLTPKTPSKPTTGPASVRSAATVSTYCNQGRRYRVFQTLSFSSVSRTKPVCYRPPGRFFCGLCKAFLLAPWQRTGLPTFSPSPLGRGPG